MRTYFYLITAAMLAAMTSCGTAKYIPTEEEELTQTWAGKEYSDIVQSYGAPDRVETDGKDGSIMVYEEFANVLESQTNTRDTIFGPSVSTTVTNRDKKLYTNFFLNPEGHCYLVKTNREVPGSAMEKHTMKKLWIGMGIATGVLFLIPIILNASHEREFNSWRAEHGFH
ncbi:MAG: hypothetical protein IKV62_03040 [Bacteroidales bacterium]|nr:hypothetical protein [Bacteroidales bacterium]